MLVLRSYLGFSLASLSDRIMQAGVVILVIAVGLGGLIFWLLLRRWGPALRQLASSVDHEAEAAEKSLDALHQQASAQEKRSKRQEASVSSALSGVQSLGRITEDLEYQAAKLNQLAQQLVAESSLHGSPASSITQSLVDSTEHLIEKTTYARRAYRSLCHSMSQVAAETGGLHDINEDAHRSVRELTGSLQRVRHTVRDQRGGRAAARSQPNSTRGHQHDVPALPESPPRRRTRPTPPEDWIDPDESLASPVSHREMPDRHPADHASGLRKGPARYAGKEEPRKGPPRFASQEESHMAAPRYPEEELRKGASRYADQEEPRRRSSYIEEEPSPGTRLPHAEPEPPQRGERRPTHQRNHPNEYVPPDPRFPSPPRERAAEPPRRQTYPPVRRPERDQEDHPWEPPARRSPTPEDGRRPPTNNDWMR